MVDRETQAKGLPLAGFGGRSIGWPIARKRLVVCRHAPEDQRERSHIAVPSERWGESPLAVVEGDVDSETLRHWANERLGRHQRLCGVVVLDPLPRNANGKVLKAQLRERYADWKENGAP